MESGREVTVGKYLIVTFWCFLKFLLKTTIYLLGCCGISCGMLEDVSHVDALEGYRGSVGMKFARMVVCCGNGGQEQ